MTKLQLTIEGPGAVAATDELMNQPELKGHWETVGEDARPVDLATIATIVEIIGGTVAIAGGVAGTAKLGMEATKTGLEVAQMIYDWYQKWSNEPEQPVEKVLLILPNGERINLQRASVSQIEQAVR